MTGLLVSQHDFNLKQVLSTELTSYPPSMSNADGQMRVASGKSTLKNSLQAEVSERSTTIPTPIVMDVSALLWTIDWPLNRTVETFISGFKIWLTRQLVGADIHLCFDRYRDHSTKSTTRCARAATTRVHQLQLSTPLPARDAVLRETRNS